MNTLKWQCRRGTRELDLLLSHYLERFYYQALPSEQQAFRALLELPNEELSAYLLGHQLPNQPVMIDLIKKIQQFTNS